MTIINCDMGEGFGIYRPGDAAAMMPLITDANVACGSHIQEGNRLVRSLSAPGKSIMTFLWASP